MLIIFLRSIILFTVLLLVIRLMGKRQIGEMEPFELVITLVIAELACIPMADRSIPITYGVVAILSMFVIHQFILLLSKNSKLQSILSGKPVMVINKLGIDEQALKQLNMQTNDILQALRSVGYFSLEEVDYGLMETNGALTVVAKKETEGKQQTLPVPIIMDGKWSEDDLVRYNVDKTIVEKLLKKLAVKPQKILLFTIDENNKALIQEKGKAYFTKKLQGEKLLNEEATL